MLHASEEDFLWLHCQPEVFFCLESLSTLIPFSAVPEHHPHPLDGRRLETLWETEGVKKCWGAGRIRDKQKCEICYIQAIIIWTLLRHNKTQIFGKKFAWLGTHPASPWMGWRSHSQTAAPSQELQFGRDRFQNSQAASQLPGPHFSHLWKSVLSKRDQFTHAQSLPKSWQLNSPSTSGTCPAFNLASTVVLCSSPAAALRNSTRALCSPAALCTVTVVRRKPLLPKPCSDKLNTSNSSGFTHMEPHLA